MIEAKLPAHLSIQAAHKPESGGNYRRTVIWRASFEPRLPAPARREAHLKSRSRRACRDALAWNWGYYRVGVVMAPSPVIPSFLAIRFSPFMIGFVAFIPVVAPRPIFVVIPYMPIPAVRIVVPLVVVPVVVIMVVIRAQYRAHGSRQDGRQ